MTYLAFALWIALFVFMFVQMCGYVWTVHVNYARKYVEMDCGHFGTHVNLKYSESSCNIFIMTAFI